MHEAKKRLRGKVCGHHRMVLLCVLVPGQTLSLSWLTLAFVKRWCICGFASLTHSTQKMSHLKLHFSLPHAYFNVLLLMLVIERPPYAINLTKDFFFFLYVCMCVNGGAKPGQKGLIILVNIWIFASSMPQVFFKHFQTMSAICQFRYLAIAVIQNVLH